MDWGGRPLGWEGSSHGLGDRLQETVNGVTTTFVMDLAGGLSQALSDGTHDYLYGNGRIAQLNTTTQTADYFLTDALGSVRQLTDSTGAVTFAQGYDPYGTVSTTSGGGSSYGFANEYQSQGLVYLRARHYAPSLGRFLTRDTWEGNANRPMSFNKWMYVSANPVNRIDPTGNRESDTIDCRHPRDDEEEVECNKQQQKFPSALFHFERLPISSPDWVQPFGATLFAKNHGAAYNYTGYCRGYHCGIDFGAKPGTPVYSGITGYIALAMEGYVYLYVNYKDFKNKFTGQPYYKVLFQHVTRTPLRSGSWAYPNTIIGYINNKDAHVHLEISYVAEKASASDKFAKVFINPTSFMTVGQIDYLESIRIRQQADESTIESGTFTNQKGCWTQIMTILRGKGTLP